jgi:hypothetical protein
LGAGSDHMDSNPPVCVTATHLLERQIPIMRED